MTLKELEKALLAYRGDYSSPREAYPIGVQTIDAILDDLQRTMSISKDWAKSRVHSFFYADSRKFKEADTDTQCIGNADFQFFTNTFADQRSGMERIANRLKNFLNNAFGISFGNFVSIDIYVDQFWIIFADRFTIKVNIFESDEIVEED